jgi:peptidyl-prolyl cis-trans isomerase D
MALIGSIRKRSGLLVGIVGAALVVFILTDLFSNRGGQGMGTQEVGVVDGQPIAIAELEARVEDEVNTYQNDFGQSVDGTMREQLRQRIWNDMLKERLLLAQVERAGFGSTLVRDEYDDVRFGNNILAEFKEQPNFQDPATGQPNKEMLKTYFNNVQQNAPIYHGIQKRRIVQDRLYAKYNTLVKKSLYVNSVQAKAEVEMRETKATFDFVAKRYDSEPDSLYPVSEDQLLAFYNGHKNERKYRQKESRAFDYVTFPVAPSESDMAQAEGEIVALVTPFAESTNDSLFVVANSETKVYSATAYTPGSLDAVTDSAITAGAPGTVVGPYRDGEFWKLAKVKELADVPEARVRHILLTTEGGRTLEQLKAQADSIRTVVRRNKNFEAMVGLYSKDPGSISTGGVYEWFGKEKMVPEFTKASFDNPVGTIDIVETSYGVHLVEVLGQRTRKERRVMYVDKRVKPLPDTFTEVYKTANDFSMRHSQTDSFKIAAERKGYAFSTMDELRTDQRYVPGLQEPNALISWVNGHEVGEVSEPLQLGEAYVVALLRAVREEGKPELEDVREKFTEEARKEQKAKALMERLQGKTDLGALATELGVSVATVPDLALSAYSLPGGYSESELIGQIFTLADGTTSVPLKGDQGVYVVSMKNVTPAAEATDLARDKETLLTRQQGRAETAVYNALKEAKGVKDLRHKFF